MSADWRQGERGKEVRRELVSVDKFDDREFIDYRDDIHELHFSQDTFDAIACIAVVEHVPRPWVAIAELHRVLKPGGTIWLSLPLSYPYHEAPKDYWRATPDGLRIWMEDFEEISCGVNYWSRSSLACSTHFYGRKPRATQAMAGPGAGGPT
jgi:SAM-dependent methyltransferase